jgi:DNA-binding PadR family transcriptional regulator
MSTASKNIDLRELAGDLIGLIKDRAKDAAKAVTKPDAAMVQNAVLSTIADEPKNAAEITRLLTLASAGAWNPTSGEIQVALTTLTAEKLATAKVDGDRKVYSITKAGKTRLKESSATGASTSNSSDEGRRQFNSLADMATMAGINLTPEFREAAKKLAPAMLDMAKTGTKAQQAAAAALLAETRDKMHAILAEK